MNIYTQTIAELEQALPSTQGKKRTTLLHKLAEQYSAVCPQKAYSLLQEAQERSRAVNDAPATAHGLLLLSRWYISSGDQERAWEALSQAEVLAATAGNRILSTELLITASMLYYNRNQLHEALAAIEQAHAMSDPQHIYYIQSLASMGFLYYAAGWYDRAYQVLADTLALIENPGSLQETLHTRQVLQVHVACLRVLAALHTALGNHEAASDFAHRGFSLCRNTGYLSEMINLCYTLGELATLRGHHEQAIDHYRQALDTAETIDNKACICAAYIRLAGAFLALAHCDTASEYLSMAFAVIGEIHSAQLGAEAWFCRAGILAATGNNTQAVAALHTALQQAQDSAPDMQSRICATLAGLYERMDDPGEAYVWYRRHTHLEEQLYGRTVQEAVARIQMQYRLRTVETEKELLRLRVAQLEQQAEHRQQIISRMALNLASKHEGLAKLRTDILSRIESAQEAHRQMFRRLVRTIDSQLASDEDWTYFEQQFAGMHGEFISALSQRFPRLTPTELRVCMLLRLNFSTKDIAGILSSSVHTVHTHRRRIRRKLGVEKEAGLVALLLSVEEKHGHTDHEKTERTKREGVNYSTGREK